MNAIEILEAAADSIVSVYETDPGDTFEFGGPLYAAITGKTHAEMMKRVGHPNFSISDLAELGSGSLGTVFELDSKKVLKITRDTTEANSSIKLVGKRNKTIAEVFDVFGMKTVPAHAGDIDYDTEHLKNQKMVFGIVQENLGEPDESWKLLASAWHRFRSDHHEARIDPDSSYPFPSEDAMSEQFETPIDANGVKRFVVWMRESAHNNKIDVKKLPSAWLEWMKQAATELKTAGIKFRDLHGGNIMKRSNGEHVLIDLGVSRSAKSKIPMLARLL